MIPGHFGTHHRTNASDHSRSRNSCHGKTRILPIFRGVGSWQTSNRCFITPSSAKAVSPFRSRVAFTSIAV